MHYLVFSYTLFWKEANYITYICSYYGRITFTSFIMLRTLCEKCLYTVWNVSVHCVKSVRTLCEKCPYLEFFLVRIQPECGKYGPKNSK